MTNNADGANPAPDTSDVFEVLENMMVCYVRLLKRGPLWTPEETPGIQCLQAAHVAYGLRLCAEGRLVLNGPALEGGDLRGVGVFRMGLLAEVQVLSDADPAVRAGRLIAEIHP